MDYIRLVTNEADIERAGGDKLWIAEHWTLRGAKLWRLRFYQDTRPLESRARVDRRQR